MSFCPLLLFVGISKEEASGWARLTSPGPPWWEKELGAHLQEEVVFPFLGHPFLSSAPCPGTPSLCFLFLLLPQ